MLPYWHSDIVPDLQAGKTVLVAAHGNSLRAVVKHLDGISDADIAGLNIPTGMPLVYRLDDDLSPDRRRGASTSTPRPPPPLPPRSPARAAEPPPLPPDRLGGVGRQRRASGACSRLGPVPGDDEHHAGARPTTAWSAIRS